MNDMTDDSSVAARVFGAGVCDTHATCASVSRRYLRDMVDMATTQARRNTERASDASGLSYARILDHNASTHICVPKYLNGREQNSVRPCRLWRAGVVFVLPTTDVSLDTECAEYRDASDEHKAMAHAVVEEVRAKAQYSADKIAPLHACVSLDTREGDGAQRVNLCDVRNGMSHCAIFEQLLFGSFTRVGYYPMMGASVRVDHMYDAFPFELQGDAYDKSERYRALGLDDSEVVQDSVPVRIVSGTWNARAFAGIPACTARLRFVVVQNCYTCPCSPQRTLLHDCTRVGCVYYEQRTGEATCSMTHLTLDNSGRRLRNAYKRPEQHDDAPCYERKRAIDLRNSVMRDERYQNKSVDRADLDDDVRLRQDMEYYVNEQLSIVDGTTNDNDSGDNDGGDGGGGGGGGRGDGTHDRRLSRMMTREDLHRLTTGRSGRVVRKNRRATQHARKQLSRISHCSADARKMINTGHMSNVDEYLRHAEFRIRTLVGDGQRACHAMALVLTELVHRENVGDRHAHAGGDAGRRIIKWYTIPEYEQKYRRSAKKYMKRDKSVVVHVSVFSDCRPLRKMIDDEVRAIANKCVLFWILLRLRTEYARDNANRFAITSFAVAFAYIAQKGLHVFSGRSRYTVVHKSRFMQLALPNISHIENYHECFDLPATRRQSDSHIRRALNAHCIAGGSHPCTVSPESPENKDIDVRALAAKHPALFVGINSTRNAER